MFEEPSNRSSQEKMDSYPSRATVVGMPAYRAINRSKRFGLGKSRWVKEGRA